MKDQYIASLEDQAKLSLKTRADLESQLHSVKKECVAAIEAKESAVNQQYRGFEAKNLQLTTEMEELKRKLQGAAKDHEEAMAMIREGHLETQKEKDRVIRQLKGERDSLFEEVKALQRGVENGVGVGSRTISRHKLLSDQLSPQSIKREPIIKGQGTLNSAKSYQSNPFTMNQRLGTIKDTSQQPPHQPKLLNKVFSDI